MLIERLNVHADLKTSVEWSGWIPAGPADFFRALSRDTSCLCTVCSNLKIF